MASDNATGEAYEAEHVHAVYEEIAPHFSSTRYKPWPIVEGFLNGLPDGSVGLDIGCGNGKYLAVNPRVFIVGSDRSTNLTKFAAKHQPHAAVVADTLALPHQPGKFDFAISIAVVHHLSTPERRIEAVKTILETLNAGGKALIYVWALEQKNSRRGWDEGDAQDVMVPWVLQKQQPAKKKTSKNNARSKNGDNSSGGSAVEESNDKNLQDPATIAAEAESPKVYQRYYHLYKKGELESDIVAAAGEVLNSGYEKDNWWAIAARTG